MLIFTTIYFTDLKAPFAATTRRCNPNIPSSRAPPEPTTSFASCSASTKARTVSFPSTATVSPRKSPQCSAVLPRLG